MNQSLERLCATYTDHDLELLVEFLRRTTEAGGTATRDLSQRLILPPCPHGAAAAAVTRPT